MTSKDRTSVDHHILTGSATASAVGILTTLDTDAIIAGIETGVDDESVLARLQVEGIPILSIRRITREYIIYNNILTHQRMDVPGGRVLEDDTLQQDVLATDKTDHDRTEEAMDSLPFLVGLGCRHVKVGPLFTFGITLGGYPIVIAQLNAARSLDNVLPHAFRHLRPFDRSPILPVTVDDAFSGNRDIRGTYCRQRRLAATGIKSFKRGLDDRIKFLVGRKTDDGSHLKMKVDVTLQYDRSRKPHASRYDEVSPTLRRQHINGL